MSIQRVAVVVGVGLLVSSCGRTDPFFVPGAGEEEDTAAEEESTDDSNDESTDDGETTDDWGEEDTGSFIPDDDTGDTGVEPLTCRDMLECILGCAAGLDPGCFTECGAGADPGELQAALGLMTCIIGTCVEKDQCSFQDLQSPNCIGCIGLGLFLPSPPGCEAEAEACQ